MPYGIDADEHPCFASAEGLHLFFSCSNLTVQHVMKRVFFRLIDFAVDRAAASRDQDVGTGNKMAATGSEEEMETETPEPVGLEVLHVVGITLWG